MKKKKGSYHMKIKADGVPVCNAVFKDFDDLEKSFAKIKKKLN